MGYDDKNEPAKPDATPAKDHKAIDKDRAPSKPRVEKNLDEGLEETFPASDPVSISPGAD